MGWTVYEWFRKKYGEKELYEVERVLGFQKKIITLTDYKSKFIEKLNNYLFDIGYKIIM